MLLGRSGWVLPGGIQYLEAVLLLSKLSPEEARVLVLYCGDRLEMADIAKMLEISESDAEELLTEAALNFYDLMEPWGFKGRQRTALR